MSDEITPEAVATMLVRLRVSDPWAEPLTDEAADMLEALAAEVLALRAKDEAAMKLAEALAPLADMAKNRASDAPEWPDKDIVQVVVTIGELRAATAALAAYATQKEAVSTPLPHQPKDTTP